MDHGEEIRIRREAYLRGLCDGVEETLAAVERLNFSDVARRARGEVSIPYGRLLSGGTYDPPSP